MPDVFMGIFPAVYLGIAAFFLATTISTMGHVMMKMHTNTRDDVDEVKSTRVWGIRQRFVIVAVIMYVAGGVLDLSVNRLIPFYIRACFAALDIPIYVVLARLMLGETMDMKQVLGVVIAVIGCSSAVAMGAHPVDAHAHSKVLHDVFSYRVGILIAVTAPLFLACLYVVRDAVKQGPLIAHDTAHGRLLLLSCAVFTSSYTATWASLLVRTVSELAHNGLWHVSTLGMGCALVLMSLAQLATMADMLAMFKSVVSMPFYLICNSAGIVVLSSVVFNEVPWHPLGFGLSMVVGFIGIAFIVHKTPSELDEDVSIEILDEEKQTLVTTHRE